MEALFRLNLARPAITQDEDAPSIRLAQESPFQAELAEAKQSENPRDSMKAAARRYMTTADFIGDPRDLPFADELKALQEKLDAMERIKQVSNQKVNEAIRIIFDQNPADLVAEVLGPILAALKDSLIVIKLLPEEHSRPIEGLSNQLRDLEVILKAVADPAFPGNGKVLRRYRRRSMMLPDVVLLGSVISTAEPRKDQQRDKDQAEDARRQEAEGKLDLYRRLHNAVEELCQLSSEHLRSTLQASKPATLLPEALRPVQLFIKDMTAPESAEVSAEPARRLHSGNPEFTPALLEDIGFRLKPSAGKLLSARTTEILSQRGMGASERPLDEMVELLRAEADGLGRQLDTLLGRPTRRTFKRFGATLVAIATPMPSVWNEVVIGGDYEPKNILPMAGSVPQTHGSVGPAGVADLLIVKQQLVRYEAADVAHIENVLKGERKEREHTRRRETEEFTFFESETTTTEERELESTTRFEMSRETSETIRQDASLRAGLTVSGKYGLSVEFSASAEGSLSRSKEEATRSASQFSQDVTERSSRKVTERVLQRQSLRVTNEVVDKNTHLLDNVAGTEHIAGIYQWVNKVYQAQMFNYGLRTLYDFMVPEPAAFLIAALQSAHSNAVEIEKPAPFTLRPDQITEANYHDAVLRYRATGIQPAPEMYKTKSLEFKAGGGDATTDYTHTGQIQIDDGYKAIYGTVGNLKNLWETEASVDVILGTRTHRFSRGDWIWSTTLDQERDSLPFALKTKWIGDLAVAVEVKCQRTDRAMLKWRHETHAKLTEAYQARLAEYEEKIADLELQAGVAIEGANPALNLEMMKDELKKHCISILTEQHFDLFDAVTTDPYGLPQIDLAENAAEGPYVRFFEQAFEWEHMTWVTYPYFWGSKSEWTERVSFEDSDPLFNQFLKAGYCRVAVPARPGFEGAIDHFMTFGEIWNGGPLPPISNPLYLPIADEIAERLERAGEEVPQGDPWTVRIPTTLAHLRADDRLPVWVQNGDGDWVEQ